MTSVGPSQSTSSFAKPMSRRPKSWSSKIHACALSPIRPLPNYGRPSIRHGKTTGPGNHKKEPFETKPAPNLTIGTHSLMPVCVATLGKAAMSVLSFLTPAGSSPRSIGGRSNGPSIRASEPHLVCHSQADVCFLRRSFNIQVIWIPCLTKYFPSPR